MRPDRLTNLERVIFLILALPAAIYCAALTISVILVAVVTGSRQKAELFWRDW